jgi:hypothetical protein
VNLTTIEVLGKAAELGLKLGIEPPDTLTVQPVNRCPPDFMEMLRSYKPRLLSLLSLPFVMVYSKALEEIVFFCQDEATKVALVEAGADSFSIYTKAELKVLCEQNRVSPISATELRKIQDIKRTFNARITSEDFK